MAQKPLRVKYILKHIVLKYPIRIELDLKQKLFDKNTHINTIYSTQVKTLLNKY